MIYAYAVASDHILVAVSEYPRNPRLEHDSPLPWLEVSKKVGQQALGSFYAINTFKISPSPPLGRAFGIHQIRYTLLLRQG